MNGVASATRASKALALAIAFLTLPVPSAAQRTPPAAQRNAPKVAKPPGDALDHSIVSARVYLSLMTESTAFQVEQTTPTGVTFRRDGLPAFTLEYAKGYCRDARRAPGRGPAVWTIELQPALQWSIEARAKLFCEAWNRLFYASLTNGHDEGFAPPDTAMQMTSGMARAAIRDLIPKRRLIAYEIGAWTFQLKFSGLNPQKVVRVQDARITEFTPYGVGLAYSTESLVQGPRGPEAKQESKDDVGVFSDYMVPEQVASVENGTFWRCGASGVLFTWKDRRDAERFCDAFNRLVYAAATLDADRRPKDFADVVRAFRAGTRPVQTPEWNRRRVLAENAVREQNYWIALEHYEAGLREMAGWPEGWFNAALLYEGLGEWEYAVDRMQRYLELMPDAQDAKAANERIIVWTEKLRR